MTLLKTTGRWILFTIVFFITLALSWYLFKQLLLWELSLYMPFNSFWEFWGKLNFFGDFIFTITFILTCTVMGIVYGKLLKLAPRPDIGATIFVIFVIGRTILMLLKGNFWVLTLIDIVLAILTIISIVIALANSEKSTS